MTSPFPQITSPPQASAEVIVNEGFETLGTLAVYGLKQSTSSGLVRGYYGGRWGGFATSDSTHTFGASTTTYVSVLRSTGALDFSTSNTHYTDTTTYAKVETVVTGAATVTSTTDDRAGPGGIHGGSSSSGGSGTVTSVVASGGVQTASGAAITATGTIQGAHVINAQTGTTYALLTGDRGKHVTLSNAASIAVTIAAAGSAGFEDGWFSFVECIGVGAATISPTTSTINGATSLVLDSGMSAILFSDGTNYRAIVIDPAGVTVNAQTGTTYTVLSGDRGKLITHTNAAAVAVTLPQATGAFGARWFAFVQNRGAGTATYTPTTSTIDGATSLALTTGQGVLLASDGTNYFTMRGLSGGGGSGLTNFTEAVTSAAPNTLTPVVSLTATGAGANYAVALVPKGATGALLAQIPDATLTAGNVRGAHSVDWQMERGSATQVASGANATIGGGLNNTASVGSAPTVAGGRSNNASGNFAAIGGGTGNTASVASAVVPGGNGNTASGICSAAMGEGCTASGANSFAHGQFSIASAAYAFAFGTSCTADGAGAFAIGYRAMSRGMVGAFVQSSANPLSGTAGDRQARHATMQANTSSTTAVVLTTDGAAAAATNQFNLPTATCLSLIGTVVVRNPTGGDCGRFTIDALARNVGGTVSLSGTAVIGAFLGDASLNTCVVAVAADNTNKCLQVTVAGLAATALKWTFEGWSVEVGG